MKGGSNEVAAWGVAIGVASGEGGSSGSGSELVVGQGLGLMG